MLHWSAKKRGLPVRKAKYPAASAKKSKKKRGALHLCSPRGGGEFSYPEKRADAYPGNIAKRSRNRASPKSPQRNASFGKRKKKRTILRCGKKD